MLLIGLTVNQLVCPLANGVFKCLGGQPNEQLAITVGRRWPSRETQRMPEVWFLVANEFCNGGATSGTRKQSANRRRQQLKDGVVPFAREDREW